MCLFWPGYDDDGISEMDDFDDSDDLGSLDDYFYSISFFRLCSGVAIFFDSIFFLLTRLPCLCCSGLSEGKEKDHPLL